MANATPVHPKSVEEGAEEAAKKAPKADTSKGPKKVQNHIPAAAGNYYELPDGTVVRDN